MQKSIYKYLSVFLIGLFTVCSVQAKPISFSVNLAHLKWHPVFDQSKGHHTKYFAVLDGNPHQDNNHYLILLKLPKNYVHSAHVYSHTIKIAILSGDLTIHMRYKNGQNQTLKIHNKTDSSFNLTLLHKGHFQINKRKIEAFIVIPKGTQIQTRSKNGALVAMKSKSRYKVIYET